MPFHRKTTPSYFISSGNLLAGYDYINNPGVDGTSGSGAAVGADGQKSGGPNDGTYFMAFGEDATSTFLNRPSNALADNCDFIDDILNTSIPTYVSADATAVGAVVTVALTGEIYVGVSGAPNDQDQRNRLVRVTDQDDNDLEVSGTRVVAILIHDGASANVVGTESSGFRTNASVNFSPSIPDTTTYRVHYGVRNTYANISGVTKGALFEEQLRTIHNVAGEVRSLFRQIHSESSVNQDWDAAFDSTIRSLASSGLNERYRRSTTQPAGFVTGDYDTPGDGATITRDGRAVAIQAPSAALAFGTTWPDPQLAHFRTPVTGGYAITTYATDRGGDIGFYNESSIFTHSLTFEAIQSHRAGPMILDAWPRVALVDDAALATFINPTGNATLNPDAGSGATDRRTIEAAAGQYFRKSGVTALRSEVDLIEVTFDGGTGRSETYVVDSIVSDTRVSVKTMWGENADFGNGVTTSNVRLRFLQVGMSLGGNSLDDGTVRRFFLVTRPTGITTDPAGNVENLHSAPMFAASVDAGPDTGGLLAVAMAWGNATGDDTPDEEGFLYGDGTLRCQNLSVDSLTGANNTIGAGLGQLLTYTIDLLSGMSQNGLGGDWQVVLSDGLVNNTVAGNGAEIWYKIPIEDGDTLEEVNVRLDGTGVTGPHGTLPASLPDFTLVEFDSTTGSSAFTTVDDTSPNVGAYNAPHNVAYNNASTSGDLPLVATANSSYAFRIRGERGANSINAACRLLRVRFTITKQRTFNISKL